MAQKEARTIADPLIVTLPYDHPDCPEKVGPEKSRVRGRYVSVEHVREIDERTVEWKMATSSDAGGTSLSRLVFHVDFR